MASTGARAGFLAMLCIVSYFLTTSFLDSVPCSSSTSDDGSSPVYERKIVALGDLHGHLPNALKTLKMSGVIGEDHKWTGNVDFLVQTGDIIDRGDDTIALFRLMDDLRSQASAVGGRVLNHLGNHEYMNAIGDWRYVYESEIKTFGTTPDRQKTLSSGWLGQTWKANYTVTSRLPYHPLGGEVNEDYVAGHSSSFSHAALSFVHGGISPTYLDATPYPSKINGLGASLLNKLQTREQPPPYPPGAYPGLPSDATEYEKELYSVDGPLWYRGWALDDDDQVCGAIDGVLQKIGVKRLVMGHTLNYDGIVSRCNSKILLIDTGMTPAYGGILSALEVHYTLTPVEADASAAGTRAASASRRKRYIEKEKIEAIYPHKREHIHTETREVTLDI
ncbi:Metallo-dependent phosphatase [Clavulina sp. PMI_390]|nr:Metallo-dependent phosphatase [Clavulina sp. PMI_390]